jgi:mRNA-degrading endonuclease YafQ of YafQ-DinJ toxin-antitoxin module
VSKFRQIEQTSEFQKDFKKLYKRYCTLNNDFELFIETLLESYHHSKEDAKGIFRLHELNPNHNIYKARKFRCKALKGRGVNSGLRIIYAYHANEDRIIFIEIYFKADQENESHNRIEEYIKSFNKE